MENIHFFVYFIVFDKTWLNSSYPSFLGKLSAIVSHLFHCSNLFFVEISTTTEIVSLSISICRQAAMAQRQHIYTKLTVTLFEKMPHTYCTRGVEMWEELPEYAPTFHLFISCTLLRPASQLASWVSLLLVGTEHLLLRRIFFWMGLGKIFSLRNVEHFWGLDLRRGNQWGGIIKIEQKDGEGRFQTIASYHEKNGANWKLA